MTPEIIMFRLREQSGVRVDWLERQGRVGAKEGQEGGRKFRSVKPGGFLGMGSFTRTPVIVNHWWG